MKTVQMTLDEDLLETLDRIVKKLKTTRSAFARTALRQAVKQIDLEAMEERHRLGYQRRPVKSSEFSVWDSEQEWGAE
jgi:metal-responsive CopG/Arc/MetJ family transcriptional regulator